MAVKEQHFLFGYGSLINTQSRVRSMAATVAFPAVALGFRRRWGYRCPRRHYTALCVEHEPDASVNGVLIPIQNPTDDLPSLDDRELNYARTLVHPSHISFLSPYSIDPNSLIYIWIYTLPHPNLKNYSLTNSARLIPRPSKSYMDLMTHAPSAACPIPQSYIDCVLKGCLQYGLDFARQFITSTDSWDIGLETWVNDRHACLELRKYQGKVEEREMEIVDKLLTDLLPSWPNIKHD